MSDVDLKLQFLCNKLIITHKYFVGILQLYPEVYGHLLLKVLGPIQITVFFFAVRPNKRMSNSTLAMLNLFMRQQILLILISWYVERSSTYKLTSISYKKYFSESMPYFKRPFRILQRTRAIPLR